MRGTVAKKIIRSKQEDTGFDFGLTGLAFAGILIGCFALIVSPPMNPLETSIHDVSGIIEETKAAVMGKKIKDPVRRANELSYIAGTDIQYTAEDEYCLAKNIFHEAGIESHKGKLAVGTVTVNRIKTGLWGNTICSVVYAKAQFSWTLESKLVNQKPTGKNWFDSKQAAKEILLGAKVPELAKSLFYHTDYIRTPYWVDQTQKVAQIGAHIFYNTARIAGVKTAKAQIQTAQSVRSTKLVYNQSESARIIAHRERVLAQTSADPIGDLIQAKQKRNKHNSSI